MRNQILFANIIFLSLLFTEKVSCQTGFPLTGPYKIYFNLHSSFQYRELPGHWNVSYFGLTGETYMNTPLGISGSIYYGKGSNNINYLHLPPLGVGLFTVSSLILGPEPEYLIFLMFENIHYNIPYKKGVILSPYINILGADFGEADEAGEGHVLLSSGTGLFIKTILGRHLILSSDFSVKYFLVSGKSNFGSRNQSGFTAGMNLGYRF